MSALQCTLVPCLVYFKIAVAVLMLLFLPLLSFTYVVLRQKSRRLEDTRRLKALGVNGPYSESGVKFFGMHLMLAVLFLSIVIMAGLVVL